MTEYKHFIDINKIDIIELRTILEAAVGLKNNPDCCGKKPLEGLQLAMIFEKASTRTRMSFEVGMNQLGGDALLMTQEGSQLGRGETIADTASTLSRYVDIIMMRTFNHDKVKDLAQNAAVPVINGLTDYSHPCQLLADVMTVEEHRGNIKGKKIAWLGDFNNVANTWAQAAGLFDYNLVIACPEELESPSEFDNVTKLHDPQEAAKGADVIVTDTWASMGDENLEQKKELLKPYQVNDEIMKQANDDALFMHCLPAHRGEEVINGVIDGPQSVVWDEAENRLHTQKAIMLWCLNKLN